MVFKRGENREYIERGRARAKNRPNDRTILERGYRTPLGRFLDSVASHPGYRNAALGLSGVSLLAYETGLSAKRLGVLMMPRDAFEGEVTVAEVRALVHRFPEYRDQVLELCAADMREARVVFRRLAVSDRVAVLELALKGDLATNFELDRGKVFIGEVDG